MAATHGEIEDQQHCCKDAPNLNNKHDGIAHHHAWIQFGKRID
jgi:hypothetical protein